MACPATFLVSNTALETFISPEDSLFIYLNISETYDMKCKQRRVCLCWKICRINGLFFVITSQISCQHAPLADSEEADTNNTWTIISMMESQLTWVCFAPAEGGGAARLTSRGPAHPSLDIPLSPPRRLLQCLGAENEAPSRGPTGCQTELPRQSWRRR